MEPQVHPRVCGGNPKALACYLSKYGTSPRVRGKLPLGSKLKLGVRYIPACAGETG